MGKKDGEEMCSQEWLVLKRGESMESEGDYNFAHTAMNLAAETPKCRGERFIEEIRVEQ